MEEKSRGSVIKNSTQDAGTLRFASANITTTPYASQTNTHKQVLNEIENSHDGFEQGMTESVDGYGEAEPSRSASR